MSARWDDDSSPAWSNGDEIEFGVILWEVDPSDGSYEWLLAVDCYLRYDGANMDLEWYVFGDTVLDQRYYKAFTDTAAPFTLHPAFDFTLSMTDDRSKGILRLKMFNDIEDTSNFVELIAENPTDYSTTEFILSSYYGCDFDGDHEAQILFSDIGVSERGWLEDLARGLIDIALNILGSILILGFRFLASIFKIVGDLIIAALELIGVLIVAMQDALDAAIGLVQEAVEGLWTAFQTALEDIIDFIQTNLVEPFVVLLATLFFWAYDWFWQDVLGFAESPDLIAIFWQIATTTVDILLGMPQLIPDIGNWIFLSVGLLICLWWFYALFLGFAEEGFNPFNGIANFIGRCFEGPSIFGIGPIPLGLIFIPMTFFLILAPAGSIFFIW